MDHDLTHLRRAAAADPGDPALAARLDRALLRGGAQAEVMKRYHAAYVRPEGFDDLKGPELLARQCGCGETVRYQPNPAQALDALARGECAAVTREALPELLLGLAASDQHSTHQGPRRGCLRISETPFVDVEPLRLPLELFELLGGDLATEFRILPVRRVEGTLEVAFGRRWDAFTLEDLRFVLNEKVKPVYADPAAVSARLDELYDTLGFGEDLVEMVCTA